MNWQYDSYTDIGGREENEDSVAAAQYGKNLVAVVADGLGGQGDGKAASTCICGELIHCGENGAFPTADNISAAFQQANAELMSRQKNAFHMKSTAVYLCVQGNRAIWAHVGDSRLYHLYEGKICDYTLDHSASQLSVFLGNIKREDIPGDEGRNRLLRAMGTEDTPPDLHKEICLQPGRHGFLLCSDGLWEYLNDGEIENSFQNEDTAADWLMELRKLRSSRCSADCDNNSAITVMLNVGQRS